MTETLTAEQIAKAQSWALKVSKAKGSQYTPASKNAAAYILSASPPSPPVSGGVMQVLDAAISDRTKDRDAEIGEVRSILNGVLIGLKEARNLLSPPVSGEAVTVNRSDLERVLRKIELIRENPCDVIGHRVIFSVREAAARLSASITGEKG